jgi:thioredoxin-related protein
MKKFLACCGVVLAVIILSSPISFAKTDWSENYQACLARGKAEKKLVLLDFTGSDWCEWCMRLNKEVFSTPEFKNYAKDNLVLMDVDFPQAKAQSNKIKAQNEMLQQRFQVQGFPTLVVLNSNGKPIKELGYMEGGPKAFIAALKKLKK